MVIILMTISRKKEISTIVDYLFTQMVDFSFPLKVNDLLKFFLKFYKIKIIKFSEFASIARISLPETAEIFCTNNARIIYDPKETTYYIYYNDNMPKNRCKWNIIHELAHMYLDHPITLLNIKDNEFEIPLSIYEEMEEEANYFTSCCLTPYAAFIGLSCHYNMANFYGYYTIARTFFGLSQEAAYYTADNFSKLKEFNLTKQSFQPYENSLKYIIDTYKKDVFDTPILLKYQKEIPKIREIINHNKEQNEQYHMHYWQFSSVSDVMNANAKQEYRQKTQIIYL